MKTRERERKKIILLVVLAFILPVAFSWFAYFYYQHFHFKTTNHGALVNPPIQLSNLLNNTDKAAKQWEIIFSTSHCETQQTKQRMFILHQLRKALGEDQARVSLWLLVEQDCPLTNFHDFKKILLTPEKNKEWQQALHQNQQFMMDKIYLVDPLGNLFMYYPAMTNPMGIFQDLKKVLGASQIG